MNHNGLNDGLYWTHCRELTAAVNGAGESRPPGHGRIAPKREQRFRPSKGARLGSNIMAAYGKELGVRTHRVFDRPIISAELHPTIGANIQGPSMIRVPN